MKTADNRFATLFLRNRYLLTLTIILTIVAGLSALINIPRLEDPVITTRNAVIITPVPGASASRVETLVTDKIELELKEIDAIKTVNSSSNSGVSIVSIELDDHVTAETNGKYFAEIRDKLEDARKEFPPDARAPIFDDKRSPVAFTYIIGLSWSHPSEPRLAILNRKAEELADKLRQIQGTELVRLYGEPEEEITVTVDPRESAALGISTARISQVIASADSKTPAGLLRDGSAALSIEVEGELDSIDRIQGIPLEKSAEGRITRVADIATIERAWKNPPEEIALSEGRRTILVAARVQQDQRVDLWTARANDVLESFRSALGGGVEAELIFEQNVYTSERLGELGGNLALGAALVVIVVFLTLGWRASWIIGSALPLSASLALAIIAYSGGKLHQMSIFGMIIALGLLIDNAIVITDDVVKLLKKGRSKSEAVSEALGHLFIPLLSSTATTVLAFLPILLLPGNVGDFVSSIGGSVITALVVSFVVAMTLIASIAGIFGKGRRNNKLPRWMENGLPAGAIGKKAESWLLAGMVRPWRALSYALALPLIGFLLATTLGSQFFPRVDRNLFGLQVWLPPEASVERSLATAQSIESRLRANPDIESVSWLVGGSFPSVYYNLVMNQDNASHYADAIIGARDAKAVKRLIPLLQAELDQAFNDAQIVVTQFAQGPPSDSDIEFRIYGDQVKTLQDLGEAIKRELASHSEVLHARMTIPRGEPKLWFAANEDEARLAGLSLSDLALQMQANLEGLTGGSIIEDTEELPIRVRYGQTDRRSVEALAAINFLSPESKEWIPLEALGKLELRPEVSGITRRNSERVNIIRGYTANAALPIDVTNEILERMERNGFQLPTGYRLEIGGDSENQGEAIGNLLFHLPILITLTVAVLILSFRSVTISILLGLVAGLSAGFGLLATWLMGFPISFNSILGMLGLMGLAFNSSIVVIAAIRSNPKACDGDPKAITQEILGASRHLISTTLTTIGGFLPLLLFVGGDFWPPLAIVMAGGVAGSTLLAMVFIPAAYKLFVAKTKTESSAQPAPMLPISTEGQLS
ncbi:MAG: efflux RND transporter permease subunit [Verrucomicrobiota bacterium]